MVYEPAYVLERLRERIRTKFWDALPEHRYAGVLIALAIGDQRAIETVDWETFTRTGVGHLMSISGLHVTMVSGLAAAIALWLWRRSPRLVLRVAAPKAAAVAAVATAAAYTLLTGFAVPAQRTLYMVAVVAIALWLDRLQSSSRVLTAAVDAAKASPFKYVPHVSGSQLQSGNKVSGWGMAVGTHNDSYGAGVAYVTGNVGLVVRRGTPPRRATARA